MSVSIGSVLRAVVRGQRRFPRMGEPEGPRSYARLRRLQRSQPLGSTAASVVPSPGALCTVRSPPASISRSRIPTSP
jgi:hypothetical protein